MKHEGLSRGTTIQNPLESADNQPSDQRMFPPAAQDVWVISGEPVQVEHFMLRFEFSRTSCAPAAHTFLNFFSSRPDSSLVHNTVWSRSTRKVSSYGVWISLRRWQQ